MPPVPFPEPLETLGCGDDELGERREVSVDYAVADFEEGIGELEGFSGGKPRGAVAGEFELGVEEAGYESGGMLGGLDRGD